MSRALTVAVTGLNAHDNPGPGITVIRSLRAHPDFSGQIVGLAYDSLDPGIYARDLVDSAFLIPYPSQGVAALEGRLRYIDQRVGGIDVIIPTLDSELPLFIALQPLLEELGIGTVLPTAAQLDMRSKVNLSRLGEQAGIAVPSSKIVSNADDLYRIHEEISYPLVVKGVYYGATVVRSADEAVSAFHKLTAQWGYPAIAQSYVAGEEVDILAVGDGEGGLVGALPMKKTYITERGKGWAGIAIKDELLTALTQSFMRATRWRGPCELEVIRDRASERDYLVEVNPRFPAWSYLSAGAGMNLPYAVLRLAAGESQPPLSSYRVGTMFVRIAIDQIAHLEQLQSISQLGELLAEPPKTEAKEVAA